MQRSGEQERASPPQPARGAVTRHLAAVDGPPFVSDPAVLPAAVRGCQPAGPRWGARTPLARVPTPRSRAGRLPTRGRPARAASLRAAPPCRSGVVFRTALTPAPRSDTRARHSLSPPSPRSPRRPPPRRLRRLLTRRVAAGAPARRRRPRAAPGLCLGSREEPRETAKSSAARRRSRSRATTTARGAAAARGGPRWGLPRRGVPRPVRA